MVISNVLESVPLILPSVVTVRMFVPRAFERIDAGSAGFSNVWDTGNSNVYSRSFASVKTMFPVLFS